MPSVADLELLFRDRGAIIGIVGLGYVGMPLARAAWTAGFRVIGFDIDRDKVDAINAGKSYLKQISSSEIASAISGKRLHATTDFGEVSGTNAIIICVPTPLSAHQRHKYGYWLLMQLLH